MNDAFEFYQHEARSAVSSVYAFARLQEKARQEFTHMGFPSRRTEEWKYTPLDGFLQHRFQRSEKRIPLHHPLKSPIPVHEVLIDNGTVQAAPDLPEGALVLPIVDAIEKMPEKVLPHLGHILSTTHAFHALNLAMLRDGVLIYVPKETTLPLWLSHWQSSGAVYLRHIVVLEKGAHLTLFESYGGDVDACYFTNAMTEVDLAEGAKLKHYKIQQESKRAYHVGHTAVKQRAHSQFDSHFIGLGGQWVRSDLTIMQAGEGAQTLMNGLYLPCSQQHMDSHTLVEHQKPNGKSHQDYKGILQGAARAVFNGRVFVAEGAIKTEAVQQNKNLLLSPQAEIDTKPQLEIFADDVTCSHGATVGQLDQDALFYFATRGIEADKAREYLMYAFIAANIKAMEGGAVETWIQHLMSGQLTMKEMQ